LPSKEELNKIKHNKQKKNSAAIDMPVINEESEINLSDDDQEINNGTYN